MVRRAFDSVRFLTWPLRCATVLVRNDALCDALYIIRHFESASKGLYHREFFLADKKPHRIYGLYRTLNFLLFINYFFANPCLLQEFECYEKILPS